MHPEIKVLDHGFVRLIETWGSGEAGVPEAGIIEAARQSTQGAFRGWETDEKLLRFMYENNHNSPFEFCGAVIEIQAPIFVFREWHRHRTQSYSEMSARYAPLPDVNYVPSTERLLMNASTSNKQAGTIKGSLDINETTVNWFQSQLIMEYEAQESLYQEALKRGIPKELARIILPVGRYSKMRAQANLRNWVAFLTLRLHPDAQFEIRSYAKAVLEILSSKFPRVISLFNQVQHTS
jgi:thymidylate synthase (FAD)